MPSDAIRSEALGWDSAAGLQQNRQEVGHMSVATHVPNIPQLRDEDIADPELRRVIEGAAVTKSPPPSWYRTMGNNPEVAKEFAVYWDMLHRGGRVDHSIKELGRLQIAQMIGCEFCARQVSPLAEVSDEEKNSCALPDWEHPDPRTRAALHYARTLTLDDGRDAEVYQELRQHFDNAEIRWSVGAGGLVAVDCSGAGTTSHRICGVDFRF